MDGIPRGVVLFNIFGNARPPRMRQMASGGDDQQRELDSADQNLLNLMRSIVQGRDSHAEVLLHEGGTLLGCMNSASALNKPTWSRTRDLRKIADDIVALISNILRRFPSSNNIQAAPS